MPNKCNMPDDYRCFVSKLSGRARSRYHPEYSGWIRQMQCHQDDAIHYPEIIVRAQSIDDVKETIDFCFKHGRRVSFCGGLYNYGGCFAHPDTILLDVSFLNDIFLDKERKADGTISAMGVPA